MWGLNLRNTTLHTIQSIYKNDTEVSSSCDQLSLLKPFIHHLYCFRRSLCLARVPKDHERTWLFFSPAWSAGPSVVSDTWQPHGLPWDSPGQNSGVGSLSFLQGNLPNPGIEPRSPTLQADSLPAEPPGKPKNPGVGSLSILQWIFANQELNQDLLHGRQILYQLSYQGSPSPAWE